MKKLRKILILAVLLSAGVTSFTGCHTAHGFGEDIERTGQKIQDGTS